MQPYITISNSSKTERTINRSRFISQCFPVSDEAEALERLAEVRREYADASHVCYAYRIGERAETTRFSDAGEPGGTAGMPILDVLRAKDITYALCTVTRYFGGILLGAGGLVRAYSGGAAEAVEKAGLEKCIPGVLIEARLDYSRYGAVESLISRSAKVVDTQFTDVVRITASVSTEEADALLAAIVERTDGRCVPKIAGECELRLKC